MNLDELDQIIDQSTRAPLSESEGQKLKTALHAEAEETGAEMEYGENQRHSGGCSTGRQSADRRMGSGPRWAQWGCGIYRR